MTGCTDNSETRIIPNINFNEPRPKMKPQFIYYVYNIHSLRVKTYTDLLTPWSKALLEKLTGSQFIKKIPAFYGTWRFITSFTSARRLSLSWSKSIQFMSLPSHFLRIHFNIIIPSKPWSSKWSPSLSFPHQNPICTSPFPIYATCPAHLILSIWSSEQ